MQRIVVVAIVLSVVLGVGCTYKAAMTGRSQFIMFSDAEMASLSRQAREQQLAEIASKGGILKATDSEQAAKLLPVVNTIAMRIIQASGMAQRANWRVVVVKSREINANVTPDGTVVVYTGILPVAKSPQGLAVILGHEVAHVVARHGAERMSQTFVAQTVNTLAVQMADRKHRDTVAAVFGYGSRYGVLLPYSRAHESEADRLGLYFMAKAGFDPAEGPEVWRRMQAATAGRETPEFESSHPSPATRIRQMQAWVPDARRYFENRSLPLPAALPQ
jgi:predicted Zn-dependent protease